MEDFKVGDVVRLKSGGPDMTVTSVKERIIHCKWFTYAGNWTTPAIDTFPPAALEKKSASG